MRKKEQKLLITFPATTAAMDMENACRESGLSGRLIPVPGEVAAGCGMGWLADPADRLRLEELVEGRKLAFEKFYEINL